jgi:c-di-GMP-binding flagellar brake protein YcgR
MTDKTQHKNSEQDYTDVSELKKLIKNRRKEWRLSLPLSGVIDGELPNGKPFHESTVIDNISSDGAYLHIDANVTIGSKIHLTLDLPSRLTEGKSTKLKLFGTAVRIEKKPNSSKKQGVAVEFGKNYKFLEPSR